jgi:hypothetical protein
VPGLGGSRRLSVGLDACNDGGVEFEFDNELIEWRGPAPHYFVRVPAERCDELREISHDVTYGWGMVPVVVRIGGSQWETSLWPKDGGYLVPVRAWVRQVESLAQGDTVSVGLDVATRDGRQANGQGPTS